MKGYKKSEREKKRAPKKNALQNQECAKKKHTAVEVVEWSEREGREQEEISILRNKHDVKILDSLVDVTVKFLLSQHRILGMWVGYAMWGRWLLSNVVQEWGRFLLW